jgi:hypothetical protein
MDWSDRTCNGPDDYLHNDLETWLLELSNITAQNKSKFRQFKSILRTLETRGVKPQVSLDAPSVRNHTNYFHGLVLSSTEQVVEYLKTSLEFFNALSVLFQDPHYVQIKESGDLIQHTQDAIKDASFNLDSIILKARLIESIERPEEVNKSPGKDPKRNLFGLADPKTAKNVTSRAGQGYRKATVENFTDDNDLEPENRRPAGSSHTHDHGFNSNPANTATISQQDISWSDEINKANVVQTGNSSMSKQTEAELKVNRPSREKRRRMSSSDDEARVKRKHDGHDIVSPLPKKTKSSHIISHFGEEALFLADVEFEDLSDELEAQLKVKAEERAREKAKLQDSNTKRKKLSVDSVPGGVTTTDRHEQPSKRIKTDITPGSEK